MTRHFGNSRRKWLLRTSVSLAASAIPLVVREALAMGERPPVPGIYRMQGEVRVNGDAARLGLLIRPGDVIETGPRGEVVFIVGRDAYLLRSASRVETAGKELLIDVLRVVTGRVLSVFGSGERRVQTRTATIGIRGTGIYIEAEENRTYVCTCYGTSELRSSVRDDVSETVTATHHDQPRYIYAGDRPAIEMIRTAPVINHSDAELILLESLVGRTPPFAETGGPRY